jgi:HD domain-containing protein
VPWANAAYRARQFFHALFPRLDAEHLAQARSILNEGEMALFVSMEKRDQRHGLRVLHHLIDGGEDDRDLLAAALIHDCGKGRAPVWVRVANVVAPALVAALGSRSNGAYRLVHHARLGAEMAERAGSSPATVRFVGGRAAEHERDKISMLRAADDRS